MGSFPARVPLSGQRHPQLSQVRRGSDVDVNTRITKATAAFAFGALHYCFFSNQRVSLKDKGRVYAVLVLTILLHGSECWSLREACTIA